MRQLPHRTETRRMGLTYVNEFNSFNISSSIQVLDRVQQREIEEEEKKDLENSSQYR